MPRYDIVEGSIIPGSPAEVWDAVVDELSGRTAWWRRHVQQHLRGNRPLAERGAVVEGRLGPAGDSLAPRFAMRTLAAEPPHRLLFEHFEGMFRGAEEWTFAPAQGGTKVRVRWVTRTYGLYSLLGPLLFFVDVAKTHRQFLRDGFRSLSVHMEKRRKMNRPFRAAAFALAGAALAADHQTMVLEPLKEV